MVGAACADLMRIWSHVLLLSVAAGVGNRVGYVLLKVDFFMVVLSTRLNRFHFVGSVLNASVGETVVTGVGDRVGFPVAGAGDGACVGLNDGTGVGLGEGTSHAARSFDAGAYSVNVAPAARIQ
jgi:hypothetical protein